MIINIYYHTIDKMAANATEKTVVFTWGRFQPPTTGHRRLIEYVLEKAEELGGDAKVFTSQSKNDLNKLFTRKNRAYINMKEHGKFIPLKELENPLSHETKLAVLQLQYADTPIEFSSRKLLFDVLKDLSKDYTNIVLVVGEKRAQEFEERVKPYYPDIHIEPLARPENKSDKEKVAAPPLEGINNSKEHEITKNSIHAVELTEEEESTAAMSSSKLREAAIKATPQSIKFFIKHTVFGSFTEESARNLINEIRVGMGYRPVNFTGFSGGAMRRRVTRKQR